MTTENTTSAALTCPKCGGAMRSYERNAVTIDQCADCRGIFLDRGELERLVDAESSYYGGGQAGQLRANDPQPGFQQPGYGQGGHGGGHGGGKHGGQGRRGGFLGGIFD